jgi:transglutaminase-like putative cysteine protease
VIRLLAWLVRRLGPKAIIRVVFLLVALASVAMGLANAIRGLNAELLLPAALMGLIIGWWLARSPLPGWLGGLVTLALGVEIIFLRVGRLGSSLVGLLLVLADSSLEFIKLLVWGAWGIGRTDEGLGGLPDGTPILLAVEDLWADAGTLLARLFDWWLAWLTDRPTLDLVAMALTWGLMLWVVAAWAGWWVRRHDQPLAAMFPAGILLSASLFYWRGDLNFLLSLLGATLLLVVLIGQDLRERRWSALGVDFPIDVGWEVKLSGAGLSLMLVSIALLAPSISWRQMVDWAGRLVRGQTRTVQVVAGPPGPNVDASNPATIFEEDQVRAPGLPRRHLLGSGPELSERVVMVIYVEEDQGIEDELPARPSDFALGEQAPRYYWRSLTYNEYTGYGWITDGTELVAYRAGGLAIYRDPLEPLAVDVQPAPAIPPGRREVRAEVRAANELGELLYAAGDLVTVDRGFRVAWRSSQDAFGATIILTDRPLVSATARPEPAGKEAGQAARTADTSGQVLQGPPTIYRTVSLVAAVGEVQLREAGSDYPAWVEDRYLALPAEVPARVLALARDLTATEPTPYDRARAIEAYLRTFPYTLDLPSPKLDRDVVDYFLFDLRQGYCDYYATSMVVLARAAGMPARLAVGYHTGTYDEVNHRYVVTEADAHAWVEIYFPGYGWIEFEPTAGVSPIQRAPDIPPVVPSDLKALEPMSTSNIAGRRIWWLGLSGMVAFLALAGLTRLAVDSWRLRRMPPEGTVATLYRRLYRYGRRLAVTVQPGDTPFEYLTSLVRRMGDVAENSLGAAVIAHAVQEAHWLVGLYVRTRYGPYAPDATDQMQAIRTWRRLRWRLRMARVWQLWDSVPHLSATFSRLVHPSEHRPAD